MKKYNLNKIMFLILFACVFCFIACDSLWTVKETTSLSFTMDISNITSNNDDSKKMLNVRQINGDVEEKEIVVSLYNAITDTVIDKQTTLYDDNITEIKAEFTGLLVGQKVYATVIIQYGDEILFSARSESIVLTSSINKLVAKINAIFLDPSSQNADDSNSGRLESEPVETLERAIELLGGQDNLIEEATIYLMDTLNISNETKWNYDGLTIKRFGTDGFPMILTSNEIELDLGSVTLDGNGIGSGIEAQGNTTIKNASIQNASTGIFSKDGNLTLSNTAVTKNSNAIQMTPSTVLFLNGGTIVISENSQNNIPYSLDNQIYVSVNLEGKSLIGLTLGRLPQTDDEYVTIPQGNINTTINKENFFLNNNGAGQNLFVKDNRLIFVENEPLVQYYVGGINTDDSNVGTSDSPLESVQEAVDRIVENNDGKTEYVIIVNGEIREEGLINAGANLNDDGMVEIESSVPLNVRIKSNNNGSIHAGSEYVLESSNILHLNSKGLEKRVLYISGSEVQVSLENINITGGYFGGTSATGTFEGAGVHVVDSTLILEGKTNIHSNLIETGDSDQGMGGGLYATGSASIEMKDTSSISNNSILGEHGDGSGGGAYIKLASITMLGSSSITNNTTETGATVIAGAAGLAVIGDTDSIGAQALLKMNGGKIANNTITGGIDPTKNYPNFSGGLLLQAAIFELSGSATIFANYANESNSNIVNYTDSDDLSGAQLHAVTETFLTNTLTGSRIQNTNGENAVLDFSTYRGIEIDPNNSPYAFLIKSKGDYVIKEQDRNTINWDNFTKILEFGDEDGNRLQNSTSGKTLIYDPSSGI